MVEGGAAHAGLAVPLGVTLAVPAQGHRVACMPWVLCSGRLVGEVPRLTATIHMETSQPARIDRTVRPVHTRECSLDRRLVRFTTCTETARDPDHRDIGLCLRAIVTCQLWFYRQGYR